MGSSDEPDPIEDHDPQTLTIISDGRQTRVYYDNQDISRLVAGVEWIHESGHAIPIADLRFTMVELSVQSEAFRTDLWKLPTKILEDELARRQEHAG